MFDGKVTSRKIDFGGKRVKTDTKNVLDQARKQREQRAIERQRSLAARNIQACFRGYITRIHTKREARAAFAKKLGDIRGLKQVLSLKGVAFIVPSDALGQLALQLLYFCDCPTDAAFVEELLSLLTESLLAPDPSLHFLANVPTDASPFSPKVYRLSRIVALVASFIAKQVANAPKLVALFQKLASAPHLLILKILITQFSHALRGLCRKPSSRDSQAIASLQQLVCLCVRTWPVDISLEVILPPILSIPHLSSHPDLRSIYTLLSSQVVLIQNLLSSHIPSLPPPRRVIMLTNLLPLLLNTRPVHLLSWLHAASTCLELDNDVSSPSLSSLMAASHAADLSTPQSAISSLSELPPSALSSMQREYLFAFAHRKIEYHLCSVHTLLRQRAMSPSTSLHPQPSLSRREAERGADMEVDGEERKSQEKGREKGGEVLSDALVDLAELVREVCKKEVIVASLEAFLSSSTPQTTTAMGSAAHTSTNVHSPISLFSHLLTLLPYHYLWTTPSSSSPSSSSVDSWEGANVSVHSAELRTKLLQAVVFASPSTPAHLVVGLFRYCRDRFALHTVSPDTFGLFLPSHPHWQALAAASTSTSPHTASQSTPFHEFSLAFHLLLQLLACGLAVWDDHELLEEHVILAPHELCALFLWTKHCLHACLLLDPVPQLTRSFLHKTAGDPRALSPASLLRLSMTHAAVHVWNDLCVRNERRPFVNDPTELYFPHLSPQDLVVAARSQRERAEEGTWEGEEDEEEQREELGDFRLANPLLRSVLVLVPQVIPFAQRLVIFKACIDARKADNDRSHPSYFDQRNAVHLLVHRNRVLVDAYRSLRGANATTSGMFSAEEGAAGAGVNLQARVQVEFISEHNTLEAGIDGGGLFKEFMDLLAKDIVDEQHQLFVSTERQDWLPYNRLPPAQMLSKHVQGIDRREVYKFIGKMVGKAVYEQILFEAQFSLLFLNHLLGRTNTLNDMYLYDTTLYRSLLHLKHMAMHATEQDILNLELTFQVALSSTESIDLIPHGAQHRVTKANLLHYVNLYTSYLLNTSIQLPCRWFMSGFHTIVPLLAIRMFNSRELGRLISGDDKALDVENLRSNTVYTGYSAHEEYIQDWWQFVQDMSKEDQKLLLKFITSVPRQPLLGFESFRPLMCIQKVSPCNDMALEWCTAEHVHNYLRVYGSRQMKLPTAATCMNLLKLPYYADKEVLREKVLYAIRSNSGFELS